jgi:phosphoribosylamine--glycine ligase
MLYAGLMLTDDGPKVVEFNCRLGDPEAQAVLPRLKTDLGELIAGAVEGGLEATPLEWSTAACVSVVVASGGYPGAYRTGYRIDGLESLDDEVLVFHAGTKEAQTGEEGAIVTDGGRVLTVSALGETMDEARRRAYANVIRVRFDGSFYRSDIAAASDERAASVTA